MGRERDATGRLPVGGTVGMARRLSNGRRARARGAPGAWLSALVERVPEFADEQALERFVSLATARYNELNAGVAKAEFVATMLAELSSDDLAVWARGRW